MNTLFIVDPTSPDNHRNYSTMSAPDGIAPTRVDYSGYLYNNKGENLTLEEYKVLKNNPNLEAITWDEFYTKYEVPYLESLQVPFKEITEEQYYDALECLPPQRWHDIGNINVFYVMEAYTADLHSWYVKKDGKYYSALRSKFITDTQLLSEFTPNN